MRRRFLGVDRVREDRGSRPRWLHEVPEEGRYGSFSVKKLSDDDMGLLTAGPYFGALVDYHKNFPDMPRITQVFETKASDEVLWMTDGPQEVAMMTALSRGHRGRVLVTGLGMGIVQQLLLRDPAIDTVTTLEASADVALLHQDLRWWADPRHEFVHGLVEEALPDLVNSGRFDGYVLDHWDALGPHLEEKVAFLRLLEDAVQTDRSVAMWGFWWEIEQRGSSDDPDTKRLLEAIDRCRRCGLILGDEDLDDPATNFWVARGADDKDLCDACEALVE